MKIVNCKLKIMRNSLNIDPAAETKKITSFIKTALKEQGFKNAVIGLSGGVDSAVSLSLLEKSLSPENIFVAHLSYFDSRINLLNSLLKKTDIPQKNIYNISIKNVVGQFQKTIGLTKNSPDYQLRLGNIMARERMVILYDLAKKHHALVCGTENKSEFYLGYFTLFGDSASDFEPIRHLYKTQIYQLAKYLKIPKEIIALSPSAGLWPGQTDEKDFGFSYADADSVLELYFDQKKSLSEISKAFPNAQKIISWTRRNSFKHHLPYIVK
jgi:NAD+ synthase